MVSAADPDRACWRICPRPWSTHLACALSLVGPLICYEAICPGEVVDQQDRPDSLVNITNGAWFGDSSGPHEHLEAARTRAVEEALPLLSTTDTEITAAFDPRSHELAHLPHGAIQATSVSF